VSHNSSIVQDHAVTYAKLVAVSGKRRKTVTTLSPKKRHSIGLLERRRINRFR